MATDKRENEDRLLTRTEAAAYLNCKPHTLAMWASTGRYNLPFVRVGRLVRYRASDLDTFLAARTISRATAKPIIPPRQVSPAAPFGGFRKSDTQQTPTRRPTGAPLPNASGFRPGHEESSDVD